MYEKKKTMNSWKSIKLSDVCYFSSYKIEVSNLSLDNYVSTENMLSNKSGICRAANLPNTSLTVAFNFGDILLSNIRPYFKKIWLANFNGGCSNDVLVLKAKESIDAKFLYYILSDNKFFDYDTANAKGTKMPRGDKAAIMNYEFSLPPLDVQKKIAGVLGALDDKIELNNRINNNLEQQAQALFKSWFVDKTNPNRKNIKVEEFFNISIGKTPPRKEPEWFSKNPDDIIWVSISDMGNCGTFISNSSEYLTKKAVSKFNIKIVPDNTVLLSFKLTVGRVAITDGNMTTNEAIAHFITGKKEINEYLYCYLKNFNFQTMGSTSSIATAVNSKIIKAMPIVMPTEKELIDFHTVTYPMFLQIKANQQENTRLSALRDTLLPKLMSGEIDVSNVDISALTSADKLSFNKD